MIIQRSALLSRLFGGRCADAAVLDFALPQPAAAAPPRDAMVADLVDAVDLLSEANADNPIWWATDVASKNRFISPLANLIDGLLRLRAADAEARAAGRELVVRGAPWPLAIQARALARARGERVRLLAWPLARLAWRLAGQWRSWLALAKGLAMALVQVRLARRHYGGPPPTGQPVYLIKSFVYASDFDADGRHRDAFFGRFPDIAARHLAPRAGVLTVVLGFEDKAACYARLRRLAGQHVVPLEAYLGTADVLGAFARCAVAVLRHRIRVPRELPLFGLDAAAMAREMVAGGGWQLAFFQYLHGRAAERIAEHHRLVGCAMTYELNPWERPFIAGLRRRRPGLPVHGCQHSIVTQAGTGIFLGRRELDLAPLPDAVLTTGRVPARIIAKYGAYPSERIWPLGALRYEALATLAPAPRRRNAAAPIVLVALEGVHPAVVLLEYALAQAARAPHIRFRVRAHPVFPIARMREMLAPERRQFPANVEESHGRAVLDDVAECDAVLYWGTTVALEAVMVGRPIVHFDRGDALSYDPLFELEDFHWTVRAADPLAAVMAEIGALSEAEYGARQARAATYIKEYFIPVSESVISRAVSGTPATSSTPT